MNVWTYKSPSLLVYTPIYKWLSLYHTAYKCNSDDVQKQSYKIWKEVQNKT